MSNLVTAAIQGNLRSAIDELLRQSAYGVAKSPTFRRYVVLEVLFDPSLLSEEKISFYKEKHAIINDDILYISPRNSIIAQPLPEPDEISDGSMVLFPFFPSYLAFPVKPGDHVWVMFESEKVTKEAFWMCRVSAPNYVDDVNYSHYDRRYDDRYRSEKLIDKVNNKKLETLDYPNGQTAKISNKDEYVIVNESSSLTGNHDDYKELIEKSETFKITDYRPVPRYKKRPGEYVFEGTSNCLISLGTCRSSAAAKYDKKENGKEVVGYPTEDSDNPQGEIALVVGRGRTDKTSGKKIKNTLQKEELDKLLDSVSESEGDLDIKSDASTFKILENANIDKHAEIFNYNEKNFKTGKLVDPETSSGIIIKSDKIRHIARRDIQILVVGVDDKGTSDNVDESKWASVTIKTNGDIVFKPSDKGVIRLGDEEANLAVLCTEFNNNGANGTVIGQPIQDTMGGSHGSGGPTGVYAKKVLMK